MSWSIRDSIGRYGLAVLSVLIALLLRFAAEPLIEADAPFAIFLLGIFATAWYAGFCPGVVASVLSAAVFASGIDDSIRALPPAQRWVRALAFACEGALVSLFVMLLQRLAVRAKQRTDDEVRASESRFRQLADAMPQIVWAAGPDGSVDYYNHRWADYTGRSPEEAFGANGWWKRVVHPDDAETCTARWADSVRTGVPFEMECRFRMRDAEASAPEVVFHYAPRAEAWKWFLTRAVPVTDAAGRITRWYGSCTDIDDHKRAAEAVQDLSRRKDEFLAMLSHELRNPLAPILNSLQILRLAELSDPIFVAARDVIDRQVRHLAGLVDGLLDVFGLVHHQVVLQREPLDLADLARRVADDFRSTISAAGITLELQRPETPVWVDADRVRLKQVLGNLIQNAAKFSSAGDRVTIILAADDVHQRATLSVRDTGVGLAPKVMGGLFEAFGQGSQPMARRLGGLGLGLALVKGVVELHGGEVHAASAGPGRGSEFGFWVPLGPTPNRSGPATEADHARDGPEASEPRRLLIVEDNEDTAATLQLLLKRFGHDVRVAHDGRAALHLAKRWRPDVVLCDLGLPEMDGFEVASRLRHDPDTADARLIAISGYGRDEDRQRTHAAGFDLHLTKPVDPLQLRRLLSVLH